MRLAVISPVFPPYRGGTGTVALENARMAADHGIPTTVFTPYYASIRKSVPADERLFGFSIQRLKPWYAIGNAAFLPQLLWRLRSFSTIHIHYPCIGLELSVLFWRVFGKRVDMTYHMDLIGKTSIRIFLFNFYTRMTLPLLVRVADTVFVSSFDYAESSPILSRYYKKFNNKFVELPNSVDTSVYAPLNDETPSGFLSTGAYGLRREEFKDARHVILFVGGLDRAHYFKGVDVLLEAAKNVIERYPKTTLVFVGDGDMRIGYEKHAQQLGIADHVYFTGSVSREDLPLWYNRATCVVLPSVDSTEAFGVVLIEAGACGKPVIATNLPGVRSVVRDGVNGYLVEPHDVGELGEKICAILEHPDHARQMGRAGLQRVQERYAYSVVAKKYIENL